MSEYQDNFVGKVSRLGDISIEVQIQTALGERSTQR